MNTSSVKFATIDEYIAAWPKPIQERLQAIRKIAHEEAPEATEAIKYGMPTAVLNGNMLCYGAFKEHISVFPWSDEMLKAIEELAPYAKGSGTIKFPADQELPLELIRRVIAFRTLQYRAKKA